MNLVRVKYHIQLLQVALPLGFCPWPSTRSTFPTLLFASFKLFVCCLLVSAMQAACNVFSKLCSLSINLSCENGSLIPRTNMDVIQDCLTVLLFPFDKQISIEVPRCQRRTISFDLLFYGLNFIPHKIWKKLPHILCQAHGAAQRLESSCPFYRVRSQLCTSPRTFSSDAMLQLYSSPHSVSELRVVSGAPSHFWHHEVFFEKTTHTQDGGHRTHFRTIGMRQA